MDAEGRQERFRNGSLGQRERLAREGVDHRPLAGNPPQITSLPSARPRGVAASRLAERHPALNDLAADHPGLLDEAAAEIAVASGCRPQDDVANPQPCAVEFATVFFEHASDGVGSDQRPHDLVEADLERHLLADRFGGPAGLCQEGREILSSDRYLFLKPNEGGFNFARFDHDARAGHLRPQNPLVDDLLEDRRRRPLPLLALRQFAETKTPQDHVDIRPADRLRAAAGDDLVLIGRCACSPGQRDREHEPANEKLTERKRGWPHTNATLGRLENEHSRIIAAVDGPQKPGGHRRSGWRRSSVAGKM